MGMGPKPSGKPAPGGDPTTKPLGAKKARSQKVEQKKHGHAARGIYQNAIDNKDSKTSKAAKTHRR